MQREDLFAFAVRLRWYAVGGVIVSWVVLLVLSYFGLLA